MATPKLIQAYWNLVRAAKRWLAITLGLFMLATAAGVVIGIAKPGLMEQVCEHVGGGRETGFPAFVLILKNNLRVMLITWCGSLVLGKLEVVDTFHNKTNSVELVRELKP